MNIQNAVVEWESKNRRMGCVAATDWFCERVEGFYPVRLTRYTRGGDEYQHVVATDGYIIIDLAPYADAPSNYNPNIDGKVKPNLGEMK